MNLLITGGCGFIGTNIALEARKRGYRVVAFDSLFRDGVEQNVSILEKAGVEVFRGDVRCEEDIKRLKIECGIFNGIIHLAANPSVPFSIRYPRYDFEVNVVGTINMLELAQKMNNCPFIFASTSKVYSDIMNDLPVIEEKTRYLWEDTRFEGINEVYPIDGFGKYPHSPYGISKLAADQYCQEYFHMFGVPTVVNRMGCIYGYYQKGVADQGWIDWFIRSIGFGDKNIIFYGNGKQVRDMLWVEDVARLYIDELENIDKVKGEVFTVGGGKENTLSLSEAVQEIEKITGKKAKITKKEWRHADQKIYISDIKKVKKVLSWNPTISPKEGIKQIYKKYKEYL